VHDLVIFTGCQVRLVNGRCLLYRISVIGKKFAGSSDCTEQWYGTEYSHAKLSEDVLQVESFRIV